MTIPNDKEEFGVTVGGNIFPLRERGGCHCCLKDAADLVKRVVDVHLPFLEMRRLSVQDAMCVARLQLAERLIREAIWP